MADLLSEKTAVVTGASSGIGRAIAHAFAENGADVVIADVREDPREGGRPTYELIEEETDQSVTYVECDVTSVEDLEAMIDAANPFGGVDVLVNNAGVFRPEEFLEVAPDEYEQIMNVNVKGAFFSSQLAAEHMIENDGGCIINVSSIAGILGNGSYVTYCVSKGALRTLTYALAHRLGPEGVRVNAIHPGGVETAMMEDAHMGPDALEQFTRAIPSRRIGEPDDIAGAALFLASELSSYVNGESLVVDGGYTYTG